jgi:hypothetical protein
MIVTIELKGHFETGSVEVSIVNKSLGLSSGFMITEDGLNHVELEDIFKEYISRAVWNVLQFPLGVE